MGHVTYNQRCLIRLFASRHSVPEALSSTVLITVWRLELSHVIAVMSLLSSYSYPNPKHVTFIFRIS